MNQSTLKIGIVGAGNMGRKLGAAVVAYGAQVVAVHSSRLESAQQLATEVGARIATDQLDTLFEHEIDGLVITAPPPVRLEPVRMACERGIHLMIEKPPALNMVEGRGCLEQIEEAGVVAAVGFQLRYVPLYERLQRRGSCSSAPAVGPLPSRPSICSIVSVSSWAIPNRFRHMRWPSKTWRLIAPNSTPRTPSR